MKGSWLVPVVWLLALACSANATSRELLQEAMAPTTAPPTGITFTKVSVGVFVTCAISDSASPNPAAFDTNPGDLFCMGKNDDGAIGDATYISRSRPTKVAMPGPWVDVSAGDWHACGTKGDNTGYCWGYNGGRLGTGKPDPVQASTPQQIAGNWTQVSAGHFHSCALNTEKNAYCWGNNKNGRMGNGEFSAIGAEEYEYTPQPVVGGLNFATISAKGSHTCARQPDNSAWCWGGNDKGELGIGVVDEKGGGRAEPQEVPGQWKQIVSGLRFSCGINMEDDVLCWGAVSGGNDTVEDLGPTPKILGGGHKYKKISAGMQHACGILVDDTVRCFGLGWHGQLGNGLNMSYSEPYAEDCPSTRPCELKGGGTWKDYEAGEYNSCGVKMEGSLWCTGENAYGNLGDGNVGNFLYEPTRVLDVEIPGAPPPPSSPPPPAEVMSPPPPADETSPPSTPVVPAGGPTSAPPSSPPTSGAGRAAVQATAGCLAAAALSLFVL